jgi:septum formation inhibitor MinC
MSGGEIHVDGRIRGIAKTILGGRIYRRGKLILPHDMTARE